MPPAIIISLLTTFGPPAINLITGLIAKFENNSVVTSTEWQTLIAQINLTSSDHMKSMLTNAGIDLTSPQAVSLLALTK